MSPTTRENSSPEAGNGGSIWPTITEPLSMLNSFISKYIAPLLPISSPVSLEQQPDNNDLHPIVKMMRGQELGRAIITLAVPIAVWVAASDNSIKSTVAHIVAVGLMMGCVAIWNGILFRTSFPRLANVLEQVGISLILLLLHGLVTSFVPRALSWVMWLSGAFCLVPFTIAIFYSK